MCRRLLLFIVAVVVACAAFVFWYKRLTPPPPPFLNPKTISTEQARAAQNRLEEALRLPSHAAAVPSAPHAANVRPAEMPQAPRTVTVHLSQDDINTTLAANQAIKKQMAKKGLQAAQVVFTPPNVVTVYSKIVYKKTPAVAEVTGTVAPNSAGGVQYNVQSVTVSGVPIPLKAAQKVIERASALWLPKADAALPLKVQQVSVEGKEITLTGPAKPAQTGKGT